MIPCCVASINKAQGTQLAASETWFSPSYGGEHFHFIVPASNERPGACRVVSALTG